MDMVNHRRRGNTIMAAARAASRHLPGEAGPFLADIPHEGNGTYCVTIGDPDLPLPPEEIEPGSMGFKTYGSLRVPVHVPDGDLWSFVFTGLRGRLPSGIQEDE